MTSMPIICFLAAHFMGDWLLQPRKWATSKSSNLGVLTEHVAVVSLCLLPCVALFAPDRWPLLLVNAVLHSFIDWNIWSGYKASIPRAQLETFEWYKDKRFWDTIAVDQFLHLFLIALFFL